MQLSDLSHSMLDALESEMALHLATFDTESARPFHEMLSHHMGWSTEPGAPASGGKRIRPLLLLLACAAAGGTWRPALPAAAAVELVHNFTLVHDDIQDRSPLRRGRATVWSKWGEAMAINVGDALFACAGNAMLSLPPGFPADTALGAARLLQHACMEVTRGQFLDMHAQAITRPSVQEYWPLVAGKTAALLSAATEIGALLAGASSHRQKEYRLFAYHLGLAFQIQDDILGIWGDEAMTGKSAASDLLTGKKSLPVLYGLQAGASFAAAWNAGPIAEADVHRLADLLKSEGAQAFCETAGQEQTALALQHLEQSGAGGEAGEELLTVSRQLLARSN